MTAAKLLSAVEPIIRYQRGSFRGAAKLLPARSVYEMGLQAREDSLHRLVDIWATGEASASLGFAAARTSINWTRWSATRKHPRRTRRDRRTREGEILAQVSEEAATLLTLAPAIRSKRHCNRILCFAL